MIRLDVFLNAEGMLEGVDPKDILELTTPIKIGVLDNGMVSGKPSVSLSFTLPDGKVVFAQTSLHLFQTAAKAFATRYGWLDASFNIVDGVDRQ